MLLAFVDGPASAAKDHLLLHISIRHRFTVIGQSVACSASQRTFSTAIAMLG